MIYCGKSPEDDCRDDYTEEMKRRTAERIKEY